MVLYKKPEKKILLTALHKGTEIDSYQANDSITFQVMEGKLEFRAAKASVTLKKGHLLTLTRKNKVQAEIKGRNSVPVNHFNRSLSGSLAECWNHLL
jgi:hypothetical protein